MFGTRAVRSDGLGCCDGKRKRRKKEEVRRRGKEVRSKK